MEINVPVDLIKIFRHTCQECCKSKLSYAN